MHLLTYLVKYVLAYCIHKSNRSEGLVRRDGAAVLSRDDDSLPVLVPHLVVQDLLDGLEAVVGEEDLDNQRKRSQKSVLGRSG